MFFCGREGEGGFVGVWGGGGGFTSDMPGTSEQDRRQVLYLWADFVFSFLPDLNWPLIPSAAASAAVSAAHCGGWGGVGWGGYTEKQKNRQSKQQRSLKQGFVRSISKWARHHIWHLFLQVTTRAAWIMGAAVPSASPSQEGECVPALTTSSWRRTMSPAQVGGNNDSDGCAGGRRSFRPSTPSRPRPPSCGTRSYNSLFYSNANFSASMQKKNSNHKTNKCKWGYLAGNAAETDEIPVVSRRARDAINPL